MKHWLTSNLMLKWIALILAAITWLYVKGLRY